MSHLFLFLFSPGDIYELILQSYVSLICWVQSVATVFKEAHKRSTKRNHLSFCFFIQLTETDFSSYSDLQKYQYLLAILAFLFLKEQKPMYFTLIT